MAQWNSCPFALAHHYDTAGLHTAWAQLHAGDALPWPSDPAVQAAWVLFHNGQFEQAVQAGLLAGSAGLNVANRATAVYANYLETGEKQRLELYWQVAQRAAAQAQAEPDNASAWYWQANALGRYSQGISVAKALAPKHADARIALGAFHAEVIDKVGSLIGGMTYGAKKDTGLKLFQEALKLNPGSAIAMIEYANALVMLEGDKKMKEATALYEQAAASTPLDAMEHLDVDMAQAELEE